MSAIFHPQTEEELAEVVTEAAHTKTPLFIRGGGTRGIVRNSGDVPVLDVSGLSGITLYEPSEMVISARAGTPLADVEKALAAKGQMLPFDPMDSRPLLATTGTPTIGAIAAGNISGSRRVSAGAARDHLIGVRLVNGRGECVKSGGRVMKNVTGLDLVKLNAGAFGTLGVLTEVTFKVLPVSQMRMTLRLEGLSPEAALDTMAEAMTTPFEVSAAAYIPVSSKGAPSQTLLRQEGFAESCRYRLERLAVHLGSDGTGDDLTGEAEQDIWLRIRDVRDFAQADLAHVLRVHIPPSRAKSVLELADENNMKFLIDWAGGLIWLGVPADVDIERVRSAIATMGGYPVLVRGASGDRVPPPAPAIQALGRRVKLAFDPESIFNPGILAGHI